MSIVTRKAIQWTTGGALALISASSLLPLIWMLYSSLKPESQFTQDILGLPREVVWGNYAKAIRFGSLDQYFFNSVLVTALTVVIVTLTTFVVGYFLARFRFRGRTFVYLLFVMGLLVPIHGLLVPIFLQFRSLGLLDTRGGLILAYTGINMPVAVFLFESYVHTIPRDLDEAAHIDGATVPWILSRIIFPLCAPITFTAALLTTIRAWNEFPLALVLIRSDALRTLPLGLANFQGTYFTEYTPLFAALVVVTIPILVVYIFFNQQLARGMVSGAVKG